MKTNREYCDQFRKVNALQNLPALNHDFMDMFGQTSKQSTKLMRVKQQPHLNGSQLNQFGEQLRKNQIVQELVSNPPKNIDDQFAKSIFQVTEQINKYQEVSNKLLEDTNKKKYKFNFNSRSAVPPKRIAPESVDTTAGKFHLVYDGIEQIIESPQQLFGNRDKYNFKQINDKWKNLQDEIEDKNSSGKNQKLQMMMIKFQKVRKLEDIAKISEANEDFKDFQYSLKEKFQYNHVNLLEEFFQYNSVVTRHPEFNLMYFRDLGLPSRNINTYKQNLHTQIHKSQPRVFNENSIMNQIEQSKENLLTLRLLRQSQLNINKNQVSFFDLLNISTCRINDININSCFRNDKVTKADVEKLQKKLKKYMKMHEGGKITANIQIQTEEIDKNSNQFKLSQSQKITKNNLINEIIDVHKQWKMLQSSQNSNILNNQLLRNQIRTRLLNLLKQLYKMVIKGPYQSFSMPQIDKKLNQSKIDQEGFEDKRVLWFILNIYEDVIGMEKEVSNARDILTKNQSEVSNENKFVYNKLISQVPVNTVKIYEEKHKPQQKEKTNSKSMIPKWSNKSSNNALSTIPKKPKTNTKQQINASSKITTKKDISNRSLYYKKQSSNINIK